MRFAGAIRARDGALAAVALLSLALIAIDVRTRPAAKPVGLKAPSNAPTPAQPSFAPPPPDHSGRPSGWHLPHLRVIWSFVSDLMLAGLVVAIILALIFITPRIQHRHRHRRTRRPDAPVEYAPPDPPAGLGATVSATFDAALAGVRRGEGREAIIVCWARLERIAEGAGLPRRPADTSAELAGRMLATLPLSSDRLTELAGLYREARFSSHPMSAQAIERAQRALARLRGELTGTPPLAGTGHG